MNEKDDAILEFLDSVSPAAMPQGVLHWNLEDQGNDWSYDTTVRRVLRLAEYGLVNIVDTDPRYFRISEDGRAYLEGDLNAMELERTDHQ